MAGWTRWERCALSGESPRLLALVDGEHHPPAVRAALEERRASGAEVVLAVVVGGSEKVEAAGTPPDLGVPAVWPADAARDLRRLVAEAGADTVVDLSGAPALTERRRLRLVACALAAGAAYEAPGVRYTPPPRPALTDQPAVAVVATGKRTGKTALSGAFARHARHRGWAPGVVAMGRGGPADPIVLEPGRRLDPDALLEMVAAGRHAASDYVEDAVTTGAYTVGCRRVGDGPAGVTGPSNVAAGVALAADLPVDLVVLEGSGAALPPCAADATLLVVPATADLTEVACGVPLRFLLADAVVVTFAGAPTPPAATAAVVQEVADLLSLRGEDAPEVPMALTTFRPRPLADVAGRRVFVTTTAPPAARPALVAHLEAACGATLVGVSHHLSDRPALARDLADAPPHDVILTELKAAAVDVVARAARERGGEVIFLDHEAVVVSPDRVGLADPPAGANRGVVTWAPEVGAVFDALLDGAQAAREGRIGAAHGGVAGRRAADGGAAHPGAREEVP